MEDTRRRWYVCFYVDVPEDRPTGTNTVGIDLGLKTLATLSDGTTIPALQFYRKYQRKLATAQRARNKRRIRAIHMKIRNARNDQIHKATSEIAKNCNFIVVGNVNASALVRTRFAKSVLDAGWSQFRSALEYKARMHRAHYVEADESYSSQTCSACAARSGPKGIAGLGIRHWVCSNCGATHDRDVNAARNILCAGLSAQPRADESRLLGNQKAA